MKFDWELATHPFADVEAPTFSSCPSDQTFTVDQSGSVEAAYETPGFIEDNSHELVTIEIEPDGLTYPHLFTEVRLSDGGHYWLGLEKSNSLVVNSCPVDCETITRPKREGRLLLACRTPQ